MNAINPTVSRAEAKANATQAAAELDRLAGLLELDLSELHKAIQDRDAIEQRLDAAGKQLLDLRPSDKNYDGETLKLAQLEGAYETQLLRTNERVAEEIVKARYICATEGPDKLQSYRKRGAQLEDQAVKAMLKARELMLEQYKVASECNELVGIISGYSQEFNLERPRPMMTGWGAALNDPRRLVTEYFERFTKMISTGGPSSSLEPGAWFSRRIF